MEDIGLFFAELERRTGPQMILIPQTSGLSDSHSAVTFTSSRDE